jgi:hypothetical protein
MPQIPYRANLSSAIFPMTIAKSGRTVINPGYDQNFDKRVDPGADQSSVGIPQLMYCENVLPNSEGFQSIAWAGTGSLQPKDIYTVETIRLAVEVDETTVTPDIDVTDTGDQLASWTTSPNDTGGADYRNVSQSATEGNPSPGYYTIFDRNEHIPAYFYKNYNIANTGNLQLTWQVKFGGETDLHSSTLGKFLVDSTGAGPAIKIDGVADTFALHQTTGWGAFFTIGEPLTSGPITGFDSTHWYEVVISAVRNTDGTWTILATLNDLGADPGTDPVTEAASLAYTLTFTPGGYIGWAHETPINSLGGRFTTVIDNIHVQAEAPDVQYTTIAGITNIDLAFYQDETVDYSHGNVDIWEGLNVIVPPGFQGPIDSTRFFTASVRGECYVMIKNLDETTKIYHVTYDPVTTFLEFTDITQDISGTLGLAFNINNVVALGGSYNYLVLFTPDSAIWSSTTDTNNFAPSLVSGAGSERIGNLKGDICFAKEHVAGLFLYTNNNVVFMSYTGNARYPWKFREVANSAGYTYNTQVVGDTNSDTQFGLSNARTLQGIGTGAAQLISKEASNFFERSVTWDRFDYATNTFSVARNGVDSAYLLNSAGKYRIWYVLDRYILIAYDYFEPTRDYKSLLVFDTLSQRYGKFNQNFHNVLASESTIYLVDYTLRIKYKLLVQSLDGTAEGVVLFGKFQFSRDKFLTLQQIDLESSATFDLPDTTPSFSVLVYSTLNGKTLRNPSIPYLATDRSDGNTVSYNSLATGMNHCILMKGQFDISVLALKFSLDGSL